MGAYCRNGRLGSLKKKTKLSQGTWGARERDKERAASHIPIFCHWLSTPQVPSVHPRIFRRALIGLIEYFLQS